MVPYVWAFTLCSTLVLPFWLLMIFAPRWQFTTRLMKSLWIVFPFMLTYAVLEIPYITTSVPMFIAHRLPDILNLLTKEQHVVLAWVHFIAADLFVGRWVYLDSRERNLNVWVMAPILFFCAMICPFGYVLYILYRTIEEKTSARTA